MERFSRLAASRPLATARGVKSPTAKAPAPPLFSPALPPLALLLLPAEGLSCGAQPPHRRPSPAIPGPPARPGWDQRCDCSREEKQLATCDKQRPLNSAERRKSPFLCRTPRPRCTSGAASRGTLLPAEAWARSASANAPLARDKARLSDARQRVIKKNNTRGGRSEMNKMLIGAPRSIRPPCHRGPPPASTFLPLMRPHRFLLPPQVAPGDANPSSLFLFLE